jgi:hypothetical protein
MSRALVTALALALLPATPALAAKDTLLSGYGGPGQGEQVLLGAELIGGSAGARPAAPRRVTAAAQLAVAPPRLVNPTAAAAPASGRKPATGGSSGSTGQRPAPSGAATTPAPAPARDPATSPPAALSAGRAGWPLTAGQDVAALLALAALAAVATMTPRLARRA